VRLWNDGWNALLRLQAPNNKNIRINIQIVSWFLVFQHCPTMGSTSLLSISLFLSLDQEATRFDLLVLLTSDLFKPTVSDPSSFLERVRP